MAKYETTRRLVTILCADVAGYSRLMGDDEHETVQTLSAYREVFTAQIVHHQGRLIDTAGDSVLAEFPSVVAAVQCAVEVQTTLHEHNTDLPAHRQMWFRIGINSGDVLTKDDGTIYGDSVNIAARLEALADPGGVCISGSVYDNVQTRLELAYAYLGEQSVKNIRQPVRAYQVVRAQHAPPQVIPAPWSQRPGRRAIRIAAAMLLVLAIAGVVSWHILWRSPARPVEVTSNQSRPLALPDNPSIAVLPFKNMSEDPTQEYFSDGFTDTLITDLSQLRQLVVIARNSTFTYKGKAVDVRQVGQELGVRYILEGSVQRADGRVRINAQLVDAGTGKHLWATRFDRPFDDIFAVQDTITRKIVAALDVELVEGEQARVWRRTTENPEAYDVFLRGREHHQRFTKQDTARARELYTHALTLDPKFAAAMAMLGWIYNLDADFWGVAPEESRDKMRGAAESAIALDDALGEGYSVLAFYYYRHAGDAARAIANAERALTLSPSSAHHHHIAALVLSKMGGQPARGLALIQKAFRLNPFPPPLYLGTLGEIYFDLGRYDEAIDVFQTTLRRLPDFLPAYVNLTATYRAVGREAEARVHAQKVLQINPHFSVNRWTAHFHPSVKESFQGLLLQAGLPE